MSTRTYRAIAGLERAILPRLVRFDWAGLEHLPVGGGVLVVANHLSYADPVLLDWMLVASGRWPRFLAKHQLFRLPVIGFLGRATGQIPVYRNSDRAGDALVAAADALEAGECVVMYPEGTVTRDPDLWPMTGRTGAARLALRTGVPVVPVGQWGAHQVMPGPRPGWPRFWPRRTITMRVGPPVDLSGLDAEGAERAATERIMDAITAQVSLARGETPPAGRWDQREGRRVG